jgi:hypothetical protein
VDELEFPDGDVSDQDPDVVAGLARLRMIREADGVLLEFRARFSTDL